MDELFEYMKDPEIATQVISALIKKYKPVAYSALNECLDMYQDYINCDRFFELSAKSKRKMFDAYIKEGFNEDQAITFMLNDEAMFAKHFSNITTGQSKRRKRINEKHII